MTREEAFNRIDAIIEKHEVDDVYVTITNFKDYDALRTARELLKQKPCSNCCNGNQIEKAKLCQKSYLAGMEHKQKPKTGHWKRISIDKYVQHAMAYYKCSVCDKDIIGTHNYCPNCGAKMSEIPTSPERNGKEESEVQE